MSKQKKVLIDELIEDSHLQKVEDVIFWALQDYAEKNKGMQSGVVAFSISQRMIEAEKEETPIIQNFELIDSLNL